MKNTRGFTLIEVLVVSFFLVMLTLAIVTASIEMRAAFHSTDIAADLQYESRRVINDITRDLRTTSSSAVWIIQDYPVTGTDRLQFMLPWDSDGDNIPDLDDFSDTTKYISIERDGTELLKKQIGEADIVLGENVKSINVDNYQTDSDLALTEIRITLELERSDATGRTSRLDTVSTVNLRI